MFGFVETTVFDSEFTQPSGERPRPFCLVAGELSGRWHRLFGDGLLAQRHPPYPIGPDSLVVAYYASAEVSCHRALGWPVPSNILDLHAEFCTITNGRYRPCGKGLLGALAYFGLNAMDAVEKDTMRQLAIRGGPYTAQEERELGDYCEADVTSTQKLLMAMLPHIDIERALLRGRYMAAAAQIEDIGVPIDMEALSTLQKHWDGIKDNLIERIDADYGVFDGRTFKVQRWEEWLTAHGIPWPRLLTGHLALDDDTFRNRARAHPSIGPIRELRHMLGQLRLNNLTVGRDGRNRCILSAFGSRTGRNQPSNSRFVIGQSAWQRSLIRPEPGYVISYIDWCQQEFGIAAALSGDSAMRAAYEDGNDPYMNFAIQAGAAPLGATKRTHEAVREQFKTCAIGTLYSIGPASLAEQTGLYIPYAAELLRKHRKTYSQFWRWSDQVVDYALLHNHLFTTFGWNLFITGEPNPNSLRNFPMQANGAEMLRLACCLAVERGVQVVAPVHDALLIEAKVGDMVEAIVTARRAMEEASRIVLGDLTLRTDVKSFRYPMRFVDKRGLLMWNTVWTIIREMEAGK